jgi:hypothetical protein
MQAKMKYICKKFINHQIKNAVVIMQTLNWINQCPLFKTVRHIFEISEDDHPPNTPTPLVSHTRDNWWTLDFANAFVSPGVNSRGELVPSHGASRRRLGDKSGEYTGIQECFSLNLRSLVHTSNSVSDICISDGCKLVNSHTKVYRVVFQKSTILKADFQYSHEAPRS